MRLPDWPDAPGAYRWLYADVTAGEVSAVFIFMVGAVFSPRYAARPADPRAHCAVNAAVYQGGRRRAWAFTEYPGAHLEGPTLRIGRSSLSYGDDGSLAIHVDERTVPWGGRLEASLVLRPTCPPVAPVRLSRGQPHFWQVLAARAHARLEVPS